MNSMIAAAVATLLVAGSALAASGTATGTGTGWMSKAAKTTPVATETCVSAKVKYENAAKMSTTSKNLTKAAAKAKDGATACAAGKTATGVADYDAAVKLLAS